MRGRSAVLLTLAAAGVCAAFFAASAAGGGNGPTQSATGAGQATVGGEWRNFSYTARTYSDGSVKGEAQLDNRSLDLRSHFALDCLVVSGNTAYMSGVVTESTNPAYIGTVWDFAVRDNGEGSAAPTDQITLAYQFGLPCTNLAVQGFLNGVFFPIDAGNIQVH
jgi:hypothetical protein